jgi:2-keto-4-pentenoate hydratase/2-oxohepta-3-ene-1,7-dioic acid hydratase in catechol pathway
VPVVQDKSTEDIAIAEKLTPTLKGRIQSALLPLGPWMVGKETERRTDPLPMPFMPKK